MRRASIVNRLDCSFPYIHIQLFYEREYAFSMPGNTPNKSQESERPGRLIQ